MSSLSIFHHCVSLITKEGPCRFAEKRNGGGEMAKTPHHSPPSLGLFPGSCPHSCAIWGCSWLHAVPLAASCGGWAAALGGPTAAPAAMGRAGGWAELGGGLSWSCPSQALGLGRGGRLYSAPVVLLKCFYTGLQ